MKGTEKRRHFDPKPFFPPSAIPPTTAKHSQFSTSSICLSAVRHRQSCKCSLGCIDALICGGSEPFRAPSPSHLERGAVGQQRAVGRARPVIKEQQSQKHIFCLTILQLLLLCFEQRCCDCACGFPPLTGGAEREEHARVSAPVAASEARWTSVLTCLLDLIMQTMERGQVIGGTLAARVAD